MVAAIVVSVCVASLLVGCTGGPADTAVRSEPSLAGGKPELEDNRYCQICRVGKPVSLKVIAETELENFY